jgi:hypothetical protein
MAVRARPRVSRSGSLGILERLILAKFNLRDLARHGARHRIGQIRQEIADILRQFPDLDAPRRAGRSPYPPNELAALGGQEKTAVRRRRVKMSAAQRAAVGERLRKYWAERRAKKR